MSPLPLDLEAALGAGAMVFETLHPITLYQEHNEIQFYTWSERRSTLAAGTTKTTLLDEATSSMTTNAQGRILNKLKVGDVLLFEEVSSPSGKGDLDPNHRHFVRLTAIRELEDCLTTPKTNLIEIEWAPEDALPFDLTLGYQDPDTMKEPISVARGNIVLADHGGTVRNILMEPEVAPRKKPYRPRLSEQDLTYYCPYNHQEAKTRPAVDALRQDPRRALPAVTLESHGEKWLPQQDLLSSARDAQEFVVETGSDRSSRLRFGDNTLGRRPAGATRFTVSCRLGNGEQGNIGADSLAYVDPAGTQLVPDEIKVHNPLPAQGGVTWETLEQVKYHAPQAFRRQERAVTPEDYAAMAQRHPEVQKAEATLRWTGSWHTVFLLVDRKGGYPVNTAFKTDLRSFLERFRLARHDLGIEGPRFVPLDIAVRVQVQPGYLTSEVLQALLRSFIGTVGPQSEQCFFHPDNFTFGQPVYLSQMVDRAMQITGIEWVHLFRFQRWGQPARDELDTGCIQAQRLEIIRLDNDPNAPHNGRIEFKMQAG